MAKGATWRQGRLRVAKGATWRQGRLRVAKGATWRQGRYAEGSVLLQRCHFETSGRIGVGVMPRVAREAPVGRLPPHPVDAAKEGGTFDDRAQREVRREVRPTKGALRDVGRGGHVPSTTAPVLAHESTLSSVHGPTAASIGALTCTSHSRLGLVALGRKEKGWIGGVAAHLPLRSACAAEATCHQESTERSCRWGDGDSVAKRRQGGTRFKVAWR